MNNTIYILNGNDRYSDDYKTGYYNDYTRVNSGYITYYIDSDMNKPFQSENFINTEYKKTEYITPMSEIYNTYTKEKTPDFPSTNFIRHSTFYKEDIMASYLKKMNRNKYIYSSQ